MQASVSNQNIRNVGVVAHIDAGKTTLTERILFETKAIRRMGEVPDGTTVTDFLKQERERGISIVAAAVTCHWKQWQINVIDTPGHIDFTAEVERSLAVMDGVVMVLCAVKGVQAQSETVWHQARRHELPFLVFVNKMDREGADPERVVRQLTERFGVKTFVIQYPIGVGADYRGALDLLRFESDPLWEQLDEEGRLEAAIRREALVEQLAEWEDDVLRDYLAGNAPSTEALVRALRRAVSAREGTAVLFGSSLQNQGVQQLLDAVGAYLPGPLDRNPDQKESDPLSMLVFRVGENPLTGERVAYVRPLSGKVISGISVRNGRTALVTEITGVYRVQAAEMSLLEQAPTGDIVALSGNWGNRLQTGDILTDLSIPAKQGKMQFPQPVCSVQIAAESSSQDPLLAVVLKELVREDPTLRIRQSGVNGWLLSGMGELHLEIIRERLRDEFGIPTRCGAPRVEYRQKVTRSSQVTSRFERQLPNGVKIGAEATVLVEPRTTGSGLLLEGAAAVRELSREARQAVMQGLRNVMNAENSGFPLTDMRIVLLEVSSPNGETTETAYFSAARQALQDAVLQGGPCDLEPIMKLEVTAPQEVFGNVIADLNSRRGEVLKVDSIGTTTARLHARVPLAELFGYASSLRSLSAGRGEVVAEPAEYAVRATH